MCDYLTCRSQYVVVNGAESQLTPVLSGVPQGSILGPLLFLIHINSLSSIPFSNSTKIHLYADDVLLYHIIDSPEAFYNLQNDIYEVAKWSSN